MGSYALKLGRALVWMLVASAFAILLVCGAALGWRAFKQQQHMAAWRIEVPQGIAWEGAVDIRGVKQWLQIRGKDVRKPLLLSLHGGPGAAVRPLGYMIQPEWEDDFVVVQWDQPCGGNTYRLNDEAGCGALSIDRMAQDAIAVADYLRTRFERDKVFLLGHSWGSLLGLVVAKRAPERFFAYAGSGQIVATQRANALGFEWTLASARAAGDRRAVAALLADPQRSRRTFWPWLLKYGGEHHRDRDPDWTKLRIGFLAPDITLGELAAWFAGNKLTNRLLSKEVRGFDAYAQVGTNFELPVVLLLGRHDYNTPTPLALEYFDALRAPHKRLVVFEDSAHMPMLEEPSKFAAVLREQLSPLAVGP